MATIRKRGLSWQVQIRRDGLPPITKSFRSKADADGWARETERQIQRGELSSYSRSEKGVTVGALLIRYGCEVSSQKRGEKYEASRIRTFLHSPIAKVAAHKLTAQMVAAHRDERLKRVTGETVRRELTVLRHCIEIARKEWAVPLTINPVRQITLPPPSKIRGDRLPKDAEDKLLSALSGSRVWYLRPIMLFAIETGMRRGEILSLRWADLDLEFNLASLEKTKNGHSRQVPLSTKAISIINDIPRQSDFVFPVKASALRMSWDRLRKRAGLDHVKLHSMRHEAISRFFELGLTIPEVSTISGHRTLSCLQRYTHIRPENVAAKLARLSEQSI